MDKIKAQSHSKERLKGKEKPVQSEPRSETQEQTSQQGTLQRAIKQPERTRPADVIALRRMSGNRAARKLIQAKLDVGPAGDTFEQEADQVAEKFVTSSSAPGRDIRRQEDEAEIQSRRLPVDPAGGFHVNSQFEEALKASRGGGEPLPDYLRSEMESGLGADLSAVRIHHSSSDADLSRSISAQAFTLGGDIYMGDGKYDPGSTTGKRLLAHELTHTIQQGAARQKLSRRMTNITPQISAKRIQRKTLSPNDILSALLKIPFIKNKLQETQHHRRDDKYDKGPNAQKMLDHIKEVLGAYKKNLSGSADKTTSQAMSLAVVLEGVARIIAINELNDPMLTPVLTGKLIELYRDEIGASLNKMDEKENVVRMATAITAGDPIGLYMHDELMLEEAARQVRKMAWIANQEPVAFFDLLRQRFEIEMSTFTETTTHGTTGSFSVHEATGQVSFNYLRKLFPVVKKGKQEIGRANPTWKKGATKGARKGLEFTPEAAQKLDTLKTAVGKHDQGFTGQNRTWKRKGETATHSLTTRQSAHLAEIEQKDTSKDLNSVDEKIISKLQTWYKLDEDGAANLLGVIKTGLASLPLTLTVKASDWFAKGSPKSTLYRPGSSRTNEAKYSDLFGKEKAKGTISHLGEFEDKTGQGRGKNYKRFRNWKDQKMTGNRGFSDTELPTFSAVNLNWPAHSTDTEYGVNSYGDLHFILKKENIIDRLVYTSTDHGHPHRNIYLAFADFVLGDSDEKSLTGLKTTQNPGVVGHVINSLTSKKLVSANVQSFEIQIFGELDVAKDVEKIAVAPSADKGILGNVREFCRQNNIAFEAIAKPTETVVNGNWFRSRPDNQGNNMVEQLQSTFNKKKVPEKM